MYAAPVLSEMVVIFKIVQDAESRGQGERLVCSFCQKSFAPRDLVSFEKHRQIAHTPRNTFNALFPVSYACFSFLISVGKRQRGHWC